MLDDFHFKQAPLYVEAVSSSAEGDHRLFVRVDRNAFCLMTTDARRAATDRVYAPADRKLRRDGVTDFEFILGPMRETGPTADEALAIGRRGQLRLTPRGRAC